MAAEPAAPAEARAPAVPQRIIVDNAFGRDLEERPWNTWPSLSWATMVPRVPPFCVQLNVAPTFWPTTWPVPMPEVVQPAAASAINEAPASLIEKAFIVITPLTRTCLKR